MKCPNIVTITINPNMSWYDNKMKANERLKIINNTLLFLSILHAYWPQEETGLGSYRTPSRIVCSSSSHLSAITTDPLRLANLISGYFLIRNIVNLHFLHVVNCRDLKNHFKGKLSDQSIPK